MSDNPGRDHALERIAELAEEAAKLRWDGAKVATSGEWKDYLTAFAETAAEVAAKLRASIGRDARAGLEPAKNARAAGGKA